MTEPLPHSVRQGEFKIGDLTIKTHLLSDGQRVIEAESLVLFMQWLEGDSPEIDFNGPEFLALALWIHGHGEL